MSTRPIPGLAPAHLVFPLAGFAGIVYVLYGMDRTAKVPGVSWIAAGIVYCLILAACARGRPRPGGDPRQSAGRAASAQ